MSHAYSYSIAVLTVQSSSTSVSLHSTLKRLLFFPAVIQWDSMWYVSVTFPRSRPFPASPNCIRPAFLRSKTSHLFPHDRHKHTLQISTSQSISARHTLLKLIWTFGNLQRFQSNHRIKWKAWSYFCALAVQFSRNWEWFSMAGD